MYIKCLVFWGFSSRKYTINNPWILLHHSSSLQPLQRPASLQSKVSSLKRKSLGIPGWPFFRGCWWPPCKRFPKRERTGRSWWKKTVVIADFAFTFGGCWLIKQLFLSHRKPCFKEEDSVIRITHDLIQVSSKQRGCESLENLKSTNLCWQSCSWRVHRQPCCFSSIRNLFLSEKNVISPPSPHHSNGQSRL